MTNPYRTPSSDTADDAGTPGGYAWLIAALGVLFGGFAVVAARANQDSVAPWLWLLFPIVFVAGDTIRARRRRRA